MFSQESTNLILQFYGYKENPYKEAFVSSNFSSNSTQEEIQFLNDYYTKNEKEILAKYDNERFVYYVDMLKGANKRSMDAAISGLSLFANAAAQGIATYNQNKAIEKQEEAIRKEQQRAEFAARQAENKQKYAEFQAMTNKKVHSSDYQLNTSSYGTQGSYNDMLTSDPNKNMAIQQSVQQYGVSETRNAINQASAYDAQSRSTGGYGGQVITAITSNRQAIKIQVRDRKVGGRIVAYSLGGNATGQQQWRNTDGIISKCTSNMEYQYTAYLQGVGNIYFDL